MAIPKDLALQYRNAFNDLGWVNFNFSERSKELLKKISPRIDMDKELVLISTFIDKREPWLRGIRVNQEKIDEASLLFTDRRLVLLNYTHNKAHSCDYSKIKSWSRPGYNTMSANIIYTLETKSETFELHYKAKGSGWLAALAGFSNPVAQLDTMRGRDRVEAFVQFMDSFFSTIQGYKSSIL